MPIFEFECRSCEHQFEVLVRNSERPHCPNCNGRSLEKLLSAPAGHVSKQLPIAGCGGGMSPCAMGGAAPPCGPGGCCPM